METRIVYSVALLAGLSMSVGGVDIGHAIADDDFEFTSFRQISQDLEDQRIELADLKARLASLEDQVPAGPIWRRRSSAKQPASRHPAAQPAVLRPVAISVRTSRVVVGTAAPASITSSRVGAAIRR